MIHKSKTSNCYIISIMRSKIKYPAKFILRVHFFPNFFIPNNHFFLSYKQFDFLKIICCFSQRISICSYSFNVTSLFLKWTRVLSPGFFLQICSAPIVNNLSLLLAWTMIFQLNSEFKSSPPHSFRCCPTELSACWCSFILVVRCLTIWST